MKVFHLVVTTLPVWQCQIAAFTPIPRSPSTKVAFRGIDGITSSALKARVSDTPVNDGGVVPTELELKKINDVKQKVVVPNGAIPVFARRIWRAIRRDIGSNTILFKLLAGVRATTALQGIVKIDDGIDFQNGTQKVMWFEVKKQTELVNDGLLQQYRAFEFAPALLLNKDTEILKKDDPFYPEMIGDCIDPHEAQMKVDSPMECFLQNAPAFCSPTLEDESISICDLDYLKKYQVQEGTPHRYGGIAYVKGGEIIEVSGVKKGEDGFDVRVHIFLNSFAVHVVDVRHAVMGHLALYQKYLMRLTTNKSEEYKEKWKKNKSAALLLKVMTPKRTSEVNTRIQFLIGPGNSLVGRATSFTNDGLTLLNIDQYDKFFAMPPNKIIKDVGSCGSKEWEAACQHAWEAAQKVVNTICKDLKDIDDTSLRDLAMLVWTGTFYHGFIGDFQLDNVNKGNLPFYLTGDEHKQTKAYGTLSTTIGVSTMTRTMDMATVGKYFYTEEDRDAWEEYRQALAAAAKETGIKGFTMDWPVYNAIDF